MESAPFSSEKRFFCVYKIHNIILTITYIPIAYSRPTVEAVQSRSGTEKLDSVPKARVH